MSNSNERTEKYRSDRRATEELIHLVLTKDADADNDDYWHPVWALQHRMSQILERVKELGDCNEEKARDIAATLLGQNGVENKVAVSECVGFLLGMLCREASPTVLTSIAFALGHLNDPRSIEALLPLKKHPQADVRYALVHALIDLDDERAIKALIDLSGDADRDVRNWATFGLGSQTTVDTPEVRTALADRLLEDDDEIRGEALVGLAKRGDRRVVEPLLRELESHTSNVLCDWNLITDAADAVVGIAREAGAKEWLPVLEKLKALGLGDSLSVEMAIERCMSNRQ